tara:strand:- start:1015 stop:1230 length:216 start_codon:yes stop_codon:yes gene_type:complete
MNTIFIVIYLVSFCLIAGGAFAMMYANIQSVWGTPPRPKSQTPRHPEAPKPGEEVLYVNFDRERLENLYKD